MVAQRYDRPMIIRPIAPADLEAIHALLRAEELPVEGVNGALAAAFVAEVEGELVGVAALEHHGEHGLLRSVAVAPAHRGRGLARELSENVAEEAAARGIEALYLLTEDAAGYFQRLGFELMPRDDAPEAIQSSAEFAELCPDTAVLMRRSATVPARVTR